MLLAGQINQQQLVGALGGKFIGQQQTADLRLNCGRMMEQITSHPAALNCQNQARQQGRRHTK
jgi:hypothetical protein